MRVLLVSSGSGSKGGGEIYLSYLARGLTQRGHEVYTLVADRPNLDLLVSQLETCANVRRLAFPNTYQRRLRNLGAVLDIATQRRMRSAMLDVRPNIIHVNQQVAEDGLDLLIAAKGTNVPCLSTIHITTPAEILGAKFGRSRDLITNSMLTQLSTPHIVVSAFSRDELAQRLNWSRAAKILHVPNGVEIPITSIELDTRLAYRRSWNTSESEIVLGCVGRLSDQKQPLFALQVCADLRARGLPVRLVWVGDGHLATEFRARAADLSMSKYVILDGWRDDAPSRLQAFDIFLLPSKFEALPFALLEAMAGGLPVVVSRFEGIGEIIHDGETGLICGRGNREEWLTRTEQLCIDVDLRERLAVAARKMAIERFSIARMTELTEAIYDQVSRAAHTKGAAMT